MMSISVVITTYNRADLVAAAIRSVLNQKVPDLDLIVIDDCSGDETPRVLESFGDRIRWVQNENNLERGATRNLGAGMAAADTIAFLDSDDAWQPDKLARQIEAVGLDAPSVTGIRYMDGQGRETGATYIPAPSSDLELLVNNYCLGSPSSILLPKRAFEEVGGFPEERVYQGSEDWMLLVKLLWSGWPVRIVPEPLVRYRVHAGGWTQQADNLKRSMWAACQWLEDQRLGPPGLVNVRRSRVAAAIACAYIAEGRTAEARPWGRTAVTQGPLATRAGAGWRIAKTTAMRLVPSLAAVGPIFPTS